MDMIGTVRHCDQDLLADEMSESGWIVVDQEWSPVGLHVACKPLQTKVSEAPYIGQKQNRTHKSCSIFPTINNSGLGVTDIK